MHRDLFRPRHILAVKTRHLHSKMGGCIQAMPECFLQIPDAFRQWPGCIAGQISRMHSGHGLYAPGDGTVDKTTVNIHVGGVQSVDKTTVYECTIID